MTQRQEQFDRLDAAFDLIVIGGGIVGAGIARDAALRGLSVALFEKQDFASGASSKTSKLIHGGLRYLEQHQIGLVTESLEERRRLHRLAPEWVKTLQILIPVCAGSSRLPWKIRAGLALYKRLSGKPALGSYRWLDKNESLEVEPQLQPSILRGSGYYPDCQMDDARLVLMNILDAVDAGAVCCNYAPVQSLLKANGQVCGVVVEDAFTKKTYEVQGKAVINASGAWSDMVRRMGELNSMTCLAPTKGIHIVLPPLLRNGVFVEAPQDGRMVFMLPWQGVTLVGTTESPVEQPLDALHADHEEVEYLLQIARYVMPKAELDRSHIIATFAGARPLLAFSGVSNQASREYRIQVEPSGLVSVMGGKYTTYRAMAEDAVDHVIRSFRIASKPCQTATQVFRPLPDDFDQDFWEGVFAQLSPEVVARLIQRYGSSVPVLLKRMLDQTELAEPLGNTPWLKGEVVHAFEQEFVCSISDWMERRTHLLWRSGNGLPLLEPLTALMHNNALENGIPIGEQIGAYERSVQDCRKSID